MTMRYILGLLVFILSASFAFAAEYPNELEGFKLYGKYCSGLEPMKSTVDDVKKVLGEPLKDKSGKWILWYEKDAWEILVYLFPDNGEHPARLAAKVVESIDFISTKPAAFRETKFPKAFNKADIRAADARWDEYYDAFGLVYEVYTSKPPYGDNGPGDLNRVSYRAAPHQIIRMQQFMIRDLKKDAAESKPKNAALNGPPILRVPGAGRRGSVHYRLGANGDWGVGILGDELMTFPPMQQYTALKGSYS